MNVVDPPAVIDVLGSGFTIGATSVTVIVALVVLDSPSCRLVTVNEAVKVPLTPGLNDTFWPEKRRDRLIVPGDGPGVSCRCCRGPG